MKKLTIILCFVTFCLNEGYSQISIGGMPLSFSHAEVIDDSNVMTINLNTPDVGDLLAVDATEGRSDAVWRDAVAIDVNVGINNPGVGTWYDLGEMGSVWKIRLKASGALSMEVNFDQFELPAGARLYIYNPDHSEFIGGYTSSNNKEFDRLSTHMIQGDDCVLEYFTPNFIPEDVNLHIKDVTYRYRDLLQLDDGGGSQECEIDINCDDGDAWSEAKKSVVRVRLRSGDDFFWSTGVLINNTASNCKPYLLTSLRTIINPYTNTQSSVEDLHFFRFYFDYERSECGEGVGMNKSVSGAFLRANSYDGGGEQGSDFLLLELSTSIPAEFNPFWCGWNAKVNPDANSGVCIHHPMGDVKKISAFNIPPISADYGTFDTHWKTYWGTSISGKGVTEIGSTGAPLFDEEGRVFGTLTAGGSSCDEVLPGASYNPDYFGKMSKHWIENPNPISQKLRSWLDPTGSGNLVFDGSDNPCAVGMNEYSNSNEILIWPNPASNNLTIDLDDKSDKVFIYNVSGKLVYKSAEVRKNRIKIDVSFLSQGLYFVQFSNHDGLSNPVKLVVSR